MKREDGLHAAARSRASALIRLPPVAALVCDITAVVARRLRATSGPFSLLRCDAASFARLGPVRGPAR
ncbi:MAG: hypothetical protein CSB49_07410 [Proteobacteria bacterium]|nr:MAG: hypothetical protein CSB49_07410 [Pseudomonadota bacterium]